MKGDHRSYAKAASISLLGLGLQLLLGLSLLIYGIVGRDHAAQSAALHTLIAGAVWLVLAVVFDQHRRERIEAMEAESLDAAAAREASVFGTVADELRVNAKRLAWMHRFVVPSVSLAVAAGLIVTGLLRYHQATRSVSGKAAEAMGAQTRQGWFEEYSGIPFQGWAISIGIAIAVIGFVFARFTSGMARSPVWTGLRAGSSAIVGASVFGLAIALFQFAEVLGAVRVSRYLLIAVPAASVVLGAEIIVNFLLGMYRPRKAGELARNPADSWVLGSIAAPDQIARNIGGAIGYQFGVDVTGSWAYRLLSRQLGVLALFAGGIVWLMTCLTVVGPDEQGVRVRLGQRVETVDSGLKFTLPWPIERIERTAVTQLRSIDLATARPPADLKHILWTNDHKIQDEMKVIVRAGAAAGGAEQTGSGESLSLLVVEVPLVYRITDLVKYEQLATPQTRDAYLRALARQQVVRYLGTLTEEELLGPKRVAASNALKALVASALAAAETGVEPVFCAIEGAHPPKDSADAFEGVVSAQLSANANVEDANKYALNALISAAGTSAAARQITEEIDRLDTLRQQKAPEEQVKAQSAKIESLLAAAGGQVGATLAGARAERWSKHMSQRGAAESYAGRLAAFHANPRLYFATAYFDTLSAALKDSRLYLVDDSVKDLRTVLDLKDLSSGGFSFTSPGQSQ